LQVSEIIMLGIEDIGFADRESVATSLSLEPTEIRILLVRRRESDQSNGLAVFTGFDICYPDGQPISVGLRRFCHVGTRLLLGRARDVDRALVRITLYPVASLEATLTRPESGVRCRRFYALRNGNEIRLHFLNGTPTEVVFDDRKDDPVVLHWLRSSHIRPDTPFWFDLASQLEGDCLRP
jgi:hypothetical protein